MAHMAVLPGVSLSREVQEGVDRWRADIAARGDAQAPGPQRKLTQMQLFDAVLVDVNPKDDLHTMEQPMFAIMKEKDTAIREFVDRRTGCKTRVIPSVQGLATIWDKDLLIFAVSNLVAARNRGDAIRQEVRVRSSDLFRATRRGDGMAQYTRLRGALERLRGTQIITEIETNGKRHTRPFSWLEDWEIISERDGRVYEFAMQLPMWLYDAIVGEEALSISADYFKLTSGIERRLYEIGRKHLGRQPEFRISMQRLFEKSGSTAALKSFSCKVRNIAAKQPLPGLLVKVVDGGFVVFTPSQAHPMSPQVPDRRC